jgi:hypothetical protein
MPQPSSRAILERMRCATDGYSGGVKRTYEIEGEPEVMARFERFLSYVQWCSRVGHSCDVRFSIDGDGADRFAVKQELPKVSEEDGLKMEVRRGY